MRKSVSPVRSEKDFIRKNQKSLEYHGSIWAILFYFNAMFTFYKIYDTIEKTIGIKCCIDIIFSKYNDIKTILKTYPEFNSDEFIQTINFVKKGILFSLIGTAGANLFHIVYAILFSAIYININLYANLLLFLSPILLYMYKGDLKFFMNNDGSMNYQFKSIYLIVSVVIAVLGVIIFLYRRRFVKTSSEMMKSSSKLLLSHPSLILLQIIQSLVLFVINLMYAIVVIIFHYYSSKFNVTFYDYLYASFSYYWILMTTYYVTYMTTSGVVGYEFYLGEHPSMPSFIVLHSFLRAITYQFGCACYAGLILSIFQILKLIIDFLKPRKKKKGYDEDFDSIIIQAIEFIKKCLYYILYGVILLFESIFRDVSKNALIYCAIFGLSFSDACHRWRRQNFGDKFKKMQHSIIISGSLLTNYIISTAFAVLISFNLCHQYVPDFNIQSKCAYLTLGFTVLLMTSTYYILNSLITTTANTLYLCFLEQPHVVNLKFSQLYLSFLKIK